MADKGPDYRISRCSLTARGRKAEKPYRVVKADGRFVSRHQTRKLAEDAIRILMSEKREI